MISSGTRAWYQTGTKYDTPSTNVWTEVNAFANYINSGGYQIEGPYGWINDPNNGCYLNYTEMGDTIQKKDSSGYFHTYVVNSVSGTAGQRTNANIWVSSHTANLRNVRLDNLSDGSSQNNYRNVRISAHWRQ